MSQTNMSIDLYTHFDVWTTQRKERVEISSLLSLTALVAGIFLLALPHFHCLQRIISHRVSLLAGSVLFTFGGMGALATMAAAIDFHRRNQLDAEAKEQFRTLFHKALGDTEIKAKIETVLVLSKHAPTECVGFEAHFTQFSGTILGTFHSEKKIYRVDAFPYSLNKSEKNKFCQKILTR